MQQKFNKALFNNLIDEMIELLEEIRLSQGRLTFQKSVTVRSKLAKLNVEAKKLPRKNEMF